MNSNTAVQPNRKTLWLVSEAATNPYMHVVDDSTCTCEVCKDKPRRIIVVQ